MKITRFMKLKAFTKDPAGLLLEESHNPLKRRLPVEDQSSGFTTKWLAQFREPLEVDNAQKDP